jgi:predicted permease
VLLFTIGLALATGLLFGIAPALSMSRVDAGPALKGGRGATSSRSHNRLGQALVAAQVALALFLMIGAGLFVRTLRKLGDTSAGFDQDRVAILRLDHDPSSFKGPALRGLFRRIEERLHSLPGVEAVSFSMLNFGQSAWSEHVWPEGKARTRANAKPSEANRVGSQYFQALGVPVILGRAFGPRDVANSKHLAIVNETMAKALFPDTPILGRHFSVVGQDQYDYEIIGVIADSRYHSLREKPRNMWFVSSEQEQDLSGYGELVVRSSGKPEALVAQIRSVIRAEDPNLAVAEVTTLGGRVARSLGQEKLLAKLASFFGVLALVLASIGLYGVMAYAVARRTNEIGIRMALGARPGVLMGAVLRESLLVAALGLLIGIPAALAGGRLVANQLYGIEPNDALTIAAAAALLLIVATAAALVPALRASRVDPLTALRAE